MSQLDVLSLEQARPQAREILTKIKSKLGKIPNIYAAMAHSNVALQALMSFKEHLSQGELNGKEIESIALTAGQVNKCEYCLCAHTAVARMKGLSLEETVNIRKGQSSDPKLQALIELAGEIITSCGNPSDTKIDAFLAAGYNKAALVEVVAWVSLNLFTNYFNHIAKTPIDTPKVPEVTTKRCCCS